jgi:cell wall-associated NlpC family hydrolase
VFFGHGFTLSVWMGINWRNILILLASAAFFNSAVAQVVGGARDSVLHKTDTTAARHKHVHEEEPAVVLTKVDSLIAHAYTFIGKRYKKGGVTEKGFDCSGYTMTVFKEFGIRLPHTSAGQGLVGVDVTKNNIKKGDLILFRGRSRRSKRIGHVGIVISEKGEPVRFIHSSTSEGVRIDRLEFAYYKNRYVKAVRIPDLYK